MFRCIECCALDASAEQSFIAPLFGAAICIARLFARNPARNLGMRIALSSVTMLVKRNKKEQIMRTLITRALAKTALVLGFAVVAAGAGIMPANAFTIDVPGVHVHVGPHHRYWRHYGYAPGYYDYAPCPRGFTVQDGVCKPYRGY
jgi:hypothetical protein